MLLLSGGNSYSYNEQMNPIEKHKSEIERKINQLEQKFNKDRLDNRDPPKRHREMPVDQNKVYGHPVALSKTMEMKGKQRGAPGEIARLKKNFVPENQTYAHQALTEMKQPARNILPRESQGKEEKIKQLEHMVKSLLEGQKVLEKQLNELKAKNTRDEINKSKLIDQSTQPLYDTPMSLVHPINQKSASSIQQKKDPMVGKKRSSIIANNSLLVVEGASRQKRGRKGSIMQIKRKDFQELYQELKERNRGQRRWVVQEEWKSRLWGEVEARVRQSDKQYKDTMHHNNKHQFQHLMSTYELQRKLKDDLISKVYQQCNDQIYK